MNNSISCPRCGAPLASDAPEGLCPRCLAALPFGPETALTGEGAKASRPPLTPEEIAPHFPQLEILECLGRGGMGVVYKARQKSLDRCVALKLLAPERIGDLQFSERFAREAQALAKLSHPGIVAVHDFGEAGGFFYLLMEFVDGVNLRRALSAGHFTPEQALAMVPPICDALQFAHERGIVHRDIKPENLLLDREGRIKIADFGIAKMLGAEAQAAQAAEEKAAGTPGYMAPEQKESPARADSRADIYSLGVVFYEMLTGELPAKQIEPPSRKVQVDVRIDEIVLRALEKEPALRFQTANEVRTAVTAVAEAREGSSASSSAVPPTLPIALKEGGSNHSPLGVLGYGLLLLLGIPISLLCLVVLWAILSDGRANPNQLFAVRMVWMWLGALVVLLGGVALWSAARKQKPETLWRATRWILFGLVLLSLFATGIRFARTRSNSTAAEVEPPQRVTHLQADGLTACAVQDSQRLYFVFFRHGTFTSSSSGGSNTTTMLWVDEGAIRLPNGRSFGFRRESVYPEMLRVNGAEYDLRKGTAFELKEDGTLRQCALFPQPLSVKTLPALAESVRSAAQDSDPGAQPNADFNPTKAVDQTQPLGTGAGLQLHAAPNTGSPKGPAPDGALFIRELQVAVPQESRVALELYEQINDGNRHRIADKFVFKTSIGSGLGLLLRWRGYAADHPTHPGQWMLDLVDPQNGVIFHRFTGRYGEPMKTTPLEGALPGKGTPHAIEQGGAGVFVRLLQAERETPPGEPSREWSEIQAFVSLLWRNQAGDPALFQLPPKEGAPGATVRLETEKAASSAHDAATSHPADSASTQPLPSSAKAEWLLGRWNFDLEKTKSALAEAESHKPADQGASLQELANGLVIPNLISALEGSQISITEKEFVMTAKGGNGKSYTYSVLEVPDADTVKMKMSDGEVNTFHREGDRIWTTSSGTVNIRAYFARQR